LPDGRQTILIALTGRAQEHDRQRTRTAGFDHHLLKPIELNSLGQLF
jgi:CheY-like chemotaxis protein